MPSWTRESITLLGDACHPMLPFLAQGAGMALEDGHILSRCVEKMQVPSLKHSSGMRRSDSSALNGWSMAPMPMPSVFTTRRWQTPKALKALKPT